MRRLGTSRAAAKRLKSSSPSCQEKRLSSGIFGDPGMEARAQRIEPLHRPVVTLRDRVQHQGSEFLQPDHRAMFHRALLFVPQEPAPEQGEAGEILRGVAYSIAGVLDEADEEHLRRGELFGGDRGGAVLQMRGLMGGHGAVELRPRHIAQIVHRIGQVHDVMLDIGPEAFVIGRARAQEEIPPPERAQVEIELALAVDEERAAPLLL